MEKTKTILKVNDLASELGVSEQGIRREIRKGAFSAKKFAGCYRVHRDSVKQFFIAPTGNGDGNFDSMSDATKAKIRLPFIKKQREELPKQIEVLKKDVEKAKTKIINTTCREDRIKAAYDYKQIKTLLVQKEESWKNIDVISEEYATKGYEKYVHDAYNGTTGEELIAIIDSDVEEEIKKQSNSF